MTYIEKSLFELTRPLIKSVMAIPWSMVLKYIKNIFIESEIQQIKSCEALFQEVRFSKEQLKSGQFK